MAQMMDHISDEQRAALKKAVEQRELVQESRGKDRTKDVTELIRQQRRNGFSVSDSKVRFTTTDADRLLMRGLVCLCGDRTQWLPEYEEVADWLRDNNGKGLMCIGDCGRGKTIITQRLLPLIFDNYSRLLDGSHPTILCFTAIDLLTRFEEISKYKSICIDDVGTEPDQKKYGVTHNYFAELVDLCERKDKLLVCSTNLNYEELTARYGIRAMDRLKSITRRVFFEGESMRG